MKKRIGMLLLVVTLVLGLGIVPAASVGANSALPTVVWLPPISNQGEFQLKDGSTLPIKFTLLDSGGSFVEDTGVHVDVNKVLFREDFDSTPTGSDPSGWTEHGVGTWTVEKDSTAPSQGESDFGDVYSAMASSTTYTRDFSFITVAPDFGDGVFEFKFKLKTDTTSTPRITIPVRYQDDQNWILFDFDTGVYRTGYYIFVAKTGLGWVELAGKPETISTGVWHTVKIILDGWNYKMWMDGVLELTANDTVQAFSSGKVGLGVYRNTHTHFDDVIVLEMPAAKTFNYGSGDDNVRISYDTVFSDDFGSYSLGADGAPVWTPVTGGWSIESDIQANGSTGQVYSQNDIDDTNAQRWSLAGDASWTDYVFEAKVKGIEGHYSGYGDNTWDGLVFRAVDDNHFYEYYFRTTSQDIIVVKHDGATRTVVSGPVSFTCQNDVWYTLKVAAEGNSFRFYADDVEISGLAFTDSSFASGRVGVYVWDGSEAQFDDVIVQTPHYIANLHTKDSEMAQGEYLITVWSGSGDQLGSYLVDLTESTQGKGRGKGKA